MVKRFLNKVKSVCSRFKQAAVAIVNALVIAYITFPVPVFAGGDEGGTSYLTPLNKAKTVTLSIVAAAGVLVLIYGGVKFAESFQKKDQNGEYAAIYTIAAGGIMVGISALVTALT